MKFQIELTLIELVELLLLITRAEDPAALKVVRAQLLNHLRNRR